MISDVDGLPSHIPAGHFIDSIEKKKLVYSGPLPILKINSLVWVWGLFGFI